MLGDNQKLKDALRKKDKEIKELKELLAETEAELKEYANADHMIRPRGSILESRFLNKIIKSTFFVLLCLVIIVIGLYPWFFKDKILGNVSDNNTEQVDSSQNTTINEASNVTLPVLNTNEQNDSQIVPAQEPEPVAETTSRDIFNPAQSIEVVSDLGWLNVRTSPDVENGQIIKKINSGEIYEWLEKTDNNWYKIVIDDQGHTGYVSGEYLSEK